MSRCLVTGNRGFIGGHLEQFLVSQGEDTFGFDIIQDYPTVEVLEDFMRINKIEKVYHLGAQAFIPECYGSKILSVLQSNTVFTADLLVASQRVGVQKLLYFSTSEVYGTPRYIPVDESHPVHPQSTYAATKYAAESLCRTFGRESDLDTVILRHFNIYGPEDKWPRIVPKIIKSAVKKEPLLLGNPEIQRDLTHVHDAVSIAYLLMEADTPNGEIYNSGTGRSISLRTLVDMIYGIAAAAIVGFLSIGFLLKIAKRINFGKFCIALGILYLAIAGISIALPVIA